MSMQIKLWGVRGSLPTPHSPETMQLRLKKAIEGFLEKGHSSSTEIDLFLSSLPDRETGGYGGNTICVEVRAGQKNLIIDAGSGIRRLGESLLQGPCGKGQGEAHIFFTHFHWDHLVGLPFFVPIFIPGNTIHFYAVQPELEECVRTMFRKPFFPVPFESLGAKIEFHRLEPYQTITTQEMSLTPYQLDHPDPCWGYRIEREGRVYAHCVDTEASRVSSDELGRDRGLYQNADLVLFDAQYTLLEAAEKMNWGHSAAPIGLDIALREKAKRILFTHHDPGASDEKISDAEKQTQDYLEACRAAAAAEGRELPEIDWGFAREGQLITL